MASPRATTPTRSPKEITTPQTPRWGFADSWDPYPRRSTRIKSQTAASSTPAAEPKSKRTPSPSAPRSPRFTITRASPQKRPAMSSQPAELPASPTKRQAHSKHSAMLSSAAVPSSASSSSPAARKAASALGRGSTDILAQAGMLPTPSKTPSRKHSKHMSADITAVSRNLFVDDDALAQPRTTKRSVKCSAVTLESCISHESDDPIAIFTDSQDRVPEVDRNSENPFYDGPPEQRAQRLAARRHRQSDFLARTDDQLVHLADGGTISLKEARERSDQGFIRTFRGKRIFHQDDRGKKLKGRVLFPAASTVESKKSVHYDDEEAETDIEEDQMDSQRENKCVPLDELVEVDDTSPMPEHAESACLATPKPKASSTKLPNTPVTPNAPYSPPATGHFLRSSRKVVEDTPAQSRRKPGSPFDGWARVKGAHESSSSGASKRSAPAPVSPHASAKRARY